jgi:hypothetical protein
VPEVSIAGPVRVLMVAIGGYGYHYLRALLDDVPPKRGILAGVVDPFARMSPAWSTVAALGVPVCGTVDGFYDAGHRADLAVVARSSATSQLRPRSRRHGHSRRRGTAPGGS